VAGAPNAHATYTLSQLQRIEDMTLRQNWAQLKDYVLQNPRLISGNDALAIELKAFLESMLLGGVLSIGFVAPSKDLIRGLRRTY
ncbi:hypothetical protein, partial [Phaeovulum sp.]|uniref:hypothetical protein n=1 Tax=Phaeovulum sp. TaxID=2934796 RepID=UPI003561E18B